MFVSGLRRFFRIIYDFLLLPVKKMRYLKKKKKHERSFLKKCHNRIVTANYIA